MRCPTSSAGSKSSGHPRSRRPPAGDRGRARTRAGFDTFIQRFGNSVKCHEHFQVLALDGVYVRTPAGVLASVRGPGASPGGLEQRPPDSLPWGAPNSARRRGGRHCAHREEEFSDGSKPAGRAVFLSRADFSRRVPPGCARWPDSAPAASAFAQDAGLSELSITAPRPDLQCSGARHPSPCDRVRRVLAEAVHLPAGTDNSEHRQRLGVRRDSDPAGDAVYVRAGTRVDG